MSAQSKLFPRELHVLDRRTGKYPYRLINPPGHTGENLDFVCRFPGADGLPSWDIVAPITYDTDFASIPTKWLKRILEPERLVKTSVYIPGIPWAVWIYRDFGAGPVLVGYRSDAIAYAAVIHDILCSTEAVSAWKANKVFNYILRQGEVDTRWILHVGVQIGCWVTYLQHDPVEVREDRELARAATLRWLESGLPRLLEFQKTGMAFE